MDIENLTIEQLVILKERVNSRIASLRAAAMEELVNRVRGDLSALGATPDELAARLNATRKGGRRGRRPTKAPTVGAVG